MSNFVRLSGVSATVFFLLACAPKVSYRDLLVSWQGEALEDLLQTWGRPHKIYHKTNGSIELQYWLETGKKVRFVRRKTTLNIAKQEYQIHSALPEGRYCKTSFIANQDHMITRWDYLAAQCAIQVIQ